MMIVVSIAIGAVFLAMLLVPFLFWDKGRRSLVLALRSLWLHKLRAFLSVLGIIIGTGAVIALMAFGEGSMQDALDDIRRQGANNIIVRSVKPSDDSTSSRRTRTAVYGLTEEDFDRFLTLTNVVRSVRMRVFPQEIRCLERMQNGRVVGTTCNYPEVNPLEIAAGRFFDETDEVEVDNVAVLGWGVAEALFPYGDPLGQSVQLGNYFYKVIGIVKPRVPTGNSGGTTSGEDFNNDVYIPLVTCRARFGESIMIRTTGSFTREQVQLSQVTLSIDDMDKVRPAGDVIRDMLKKHHDKSDWAVTVPLDRLEEAERAKTRYTMLLVLIAGISLFVGGIGIMNIMLATVTERTREIGIRRALGAKRRDITMQFLIEAVAQTTLGGLFGVITGLGSVVLIPFLSKWIINASVPAKVNVPSICISLAFAICVGVVFGLYPAWRASRLDPIEALRHE